MLTVLYSNSYEVLEHALLEQLNTPADTAAGVEEGQARGWASWAESVVVPNRGCRHRLEQAIARRYGICAHIDFPFLASWLWTQMACVVERPAPRAFSPESLVWAVYRLLDPATLDLEAADSPMARVHAYVTAADDRSRYSLARRISALFDRYLTVRPDWLSAWQREGGQPISSTLKTLHSHPDARWQAVLWRNLCENLGADNAPSMHIERFLEQVRFAGFSPPKQAWPARASLFVLPDISPLHLAIIGELARWIDIRLYVLNPCKEYWYDHIETGNSLLAHWGRHTQRYLHRLQDFTQAASATDAAFYMDHPEPTGLAALKNAVLNLQAYPSFLAPSKTGSAHSIEMAAAHLALGIEVHSCHSLMRQLEVLHNRLLEQFSKDPSLQPSEVLVVLPDIASAIPLIDAVFSTAQGARHIPYRHIGASSFYSNPIAQVFMQLLMLAEQEVTPSDLFEWLHVDAFAARYGIALSQLETLEGWLHAAGAVRGLGALEILDAHEDSQPMHITPRGVTFSDALMRLVLGYALPEGGQPMQGWLPVISAHKGMLAPASFSENPWESVHTQPELLGALIALCDALNAFSQALAIARTPAQWHAVLLKALEQFFAPDLADSSYLKEIYAALYDLTEAMSEGAPDTVLSATVVREALQVQLDAKVRTEPAGGGVTFSDRTAHQSIPYRVIALIGMDAGVWPSVASVDEFDLIAAFPRMGDRAGREEERALFLEYVLAAQDLLLITYTGRSLKDDSALPPAVPVDTLLDYLSRAACGEHASPDQLDAARQHFITLHPLHPFSAAYFSEPSSSQNRDMQDGDRKVNTLSTYDSQHADIAAALALPIANKKQIPFFSSTLSNTSIAEKAPEQSLYFDRVLRFWKHPMRSLLLDHWAIAFPFLSVRTEEQAQYGGESVVADWRAKALLAEKVLPVLLNMPKRAHLHKEEEAYNPHSAAAEKIQQQALHIAHACPGWPSGVLGDLACVKELALLKAYADRVLHAQNGMPYSLAFELNLECASFSSSISHFLKEFLADHPTHTVSYGVDAPLKLSGLLEGITPHGLVLYRYGSATARDYLSAWLHHLVLCTLAPVGVEPRTLWLGKGEMGEVGQSNEDRPASFEDTRAYFSFSAVEDAPARLAELLALYQAGCLKPLPFFLKSALAQATQGTFAAHQIWQGNARIPGESDDPYLKLSLRGQKEWETTLSPSFSILADAVFSPLLAALSCHNGP